MSETVQQFNIYTKEDFFKNGIVTLQGRGVTHTRERAKLEPTQITQFPVTNLIGVGV